MNNRGNDRMNIDVENKVKDYFQKGQGATIESEDKSGPINLPGNGGGIKRIAKATLLAALHICTGTQMSFAQVSLLNPTQTSQHSNSQGATTFELTQAQVLEDSQDLAAVSTYTRLFAQMCIKTGRFLRLLFR